MINQVGQAQAVENGNVLRIGGAADSNAVLF